VPPSHLIGVSPQYLELLTCDFEDNDDLVGAMNILAHGMEKLRAEGQDAADASAGCASPERRHCSRNPEWGPSDFGCTKLGDGHGLRRPVFVLRPSRRALRSSLTLPRFPVLLRCTDTVGTVGYTERATRKVVDKVRND